MSTAVEKTRYYEAILYPENMVSDWQDIIEDLIQNPCCYCVHDKDVDFLDGIHTNEEGIVERDFEKVKTHVHLIIAWSGPVTSSFIIKLCNKLSLEDRKCCSVAQPVYNMERAYDYLIHDTEKAKKDLKYQYDESERICLNNFDIHFYRRIDENEKDIIAIEIADICFQHMFMDFMELRNYIHCCCPDTFEIILMNRCNYFDKLVTANYKHYLREKEKQLKENI